MDEHEDVCQPKCMVGLITWNSVTCSHMHQVVHETW